VSTATARPELSIVVVNWNTRELLLRLLARLLPPGGPGLPAEVLVVDNASSDGSAAAASAAFPGVVVLPQPRNGGFAYGVNRGLERARGDLVLLLNTDAEADPERIGAFLAAAASHPRAAVFGPRIVDEHGAPQRSWWRAPRPAQYLLQAFRLGLGDGNGDAPREVECVSGCVFLLRRSVLAETGGFDERFFLYFEETDFCTRVRRQGHAVMYLPGTTFVHQGGLSAARSAVRTFLAFRESCLLYHAAWHGRLRTEWVRFCLLLGAFLRACAWSLLRLTGRKGRAGLHWRAVAMLARPGLVGELARRPRLVPSLPANVSATSSSSSPSASASPV
jgi:GT2 family glycosyltransferase